jgi:hypothetical protein
MPQTPERQRLQSQRDCDASRARQTYPPKPYPIANVVPASPHTENMGQGIAAYFPGDLSGCATFLIAARIVLTFGTGTSTGP